MKLYSQEVSQQSLSKYFQRFTAMMQSFVSSPLLVSKNGSIVELMDTSKEAGKGGREKLQGWGKKERVRYQSQQGLPWRF